MPYFYNKWFLDKLNKGTINTKNPYNNNETIHELTPDNFEAIVFWTKDSSNFDKVLDKLDEKKFNYYFQYTLNDYPKIIENNVNTLEKRIDTFIKLSNRIGKEKVIWRYDPIFYSSITGKDFHMKTFEELCKKLSPYTNRVVISYLDIYGKLERTLKKMEKKNDIKIIDVCKYKKTHQDLSIFLKETAEKYGLEIESCSEQNLEQYGIKKGACIDGNLINELFGNDIKHKKDYNQRKECGCMKSVDIGSYDSCLFNCSYCYANNSEDDSVKKRQEKFKLHEIEDDYI